MKQRWCKNGGIYLYLEVVKMVARLMEDLMEAGTETEEEEQRIDVE